MDIGPRVECLHCGDILQSMSQHDLKLCRCSSESSERVERCAAILNEKLGLDGSQYHLARCYLADEFGTGISVDGGAYLGMSFSRKTGYKVLDD